MTKSRAPRLAALALSGALAAASLVACGTDNEQVTEDVYCADKDGKIIDEKYCDDNNNTGFPGFIWIGGFGGGHQPGYILPRSQATTPGIPYNDPVARQNAGLPAKGKVTGSGGLGGKVTRTAPGGGAKASKGGGFGSGGSKGGTGS